MDNSFFKDDHLGSGVTNEDGSFRVGWRAKGMYWHDHTVKVYALFKGLESLKATRSKEVMLRVINDREVKLKCNSFPLTIMTTKTELIQAKAIEILKMRPPGMRTSQLLKAIQDDLPDIHPKTINGTVWKLPETRPEEVYKPNRGLFRHVSFQETPTNSSD